VSSGRRNKIGASQAISQMPRFVGGVLPASVNWTAAGKVRRI